MDEKTYTADEVLALLEGSDHDDLASAVRDSCFADDRQAAHTLAAGLDAAAELERRAVQRDTLARQLLETMRERDEARRELSAELTLTADLGGALSSLITWTLDPSEDHVDDEDPEEILRRGVLATKAMQSLQADDLMPRGEVAPDAVRRLVRERDEARARLSAELGQPWEGMPEGWKFDLLHWGRVARGHVLMVERGEFWHDEVGWHWKVVTADGGRPWTVGSGTCPHAYDAIMAAEAALSEVSDG